METITIHGREFRVDTSESCGRPFYLLTGTRGAVYAASRIGGRESDVMYVSRRNGDDAFPGITLTDADGQLRTSRPEMAAKTYALSRGWR